MQRRMDIVLVTDGYDAATPIIDAAAQAGCRVLRQVGPNDEAAAYVRETRPDAVVFISDDVDRAILREMREIKQVCPLPMVMMTRDGSEASIDAAIQAGATAYVVDCYQPERIGSVLQVARARFQEMRALREELDETRRALADRKQIEKAKGIIMSQRNLSEDDAYKAMRKLAMDRNVRVGEVAEQIVAAAAVLL